MAFEALKRENISLKNKLCKMRSLMTDEGYLKNISFQLSMGFSISAAYEIVENMYFDFFETRRFESFEKFVEWVN